MREVLSVGTERRFAHLALLEDPFVNRLKGDEDNRGVEFALEAGQAAAEMAAARWGREPEKVAIALQLPVTRNGEPARAGRAVLFSEYGDRPPSITLHMDSLGEVNRLIHSNGLAEMLGIEDVVPVHLAHELYHHLEAKKLTQGTAPFRIETFRLGPLRPHTGLPSLAEIAADRFALSLLELSVPPKALQFITIHTRNPGLALVQLERLKSLPA